MHGWAADVIGAVGTPHTSPDAYLKVFFTQSEPSRAAGQEALRRLLARRATGTSVNPASGRSSTLPCEVISECVDHLRGR
jgi:hypothetical protein